ALYLRRRGALGPPLRRNFTGGPWASPRAARLLLLSGHPRWARAGFVVSSLVHGHAERVQILLEVRAIVHVVLVGGELHRHFVLVQVLGRSGTRARRGVALEAVVVGDRLPLLAHIPPQEELASVGVWRSPGDKIPLSRCIAVHLFQWHVCPGPAGHEQDALQIGADQHRELPSDEQRLTGRIATCRP